MKHHIQKLAVLSFSLAWSIAHPTATFGKASSRQQQDGRAIIERSLKSYDKAATIQATVRLWYVEAGDRFSYVIRNRLENTASGAASRYFIEMDEVPAQSDEGHFAGGRYLNIDDGKQFYSLYPTKKVFTVDLHRPDRFSAIFGPLLSQFRVEGTRYRISSATFEGKPAEVVVATHESKLTVRCVIDKATSTLRKLEVTDRNGTQTYSTSVSDLILNAALPATTFEPPIQGYKRIPLAKVESRDSR